MTFIRNIIDTELRFYITSESFSIGLDSTFVASEHPATQKKIEGFLFDRTTWTDIPNQGIIPRNWDASSTDGTFISGIGDNDDLSVESIQKRYINSNEEWKPQINHGYFYLSEEEFYLFSDDSVIEYPTLSGVWISTVDNSITGGSTLGLDYTPKVGVPILARTFIWSEEDNRWKVSANYEKVTEFTASGIDLITQASEEIFWNNINSAKKEFLLDYSVTPPRVIFNQIVSTLVGRVPVGTPSGADLEAMEFIGTTVSGINNIFFVDYSPVDREEDFILYGVDADDNATLFTEAFTTISGVSEYIIDRDLGILTVSGDSSNDLNLYASYYKTVAVEYEPEYTRDTIEVIDADLNPLQKFSGSGFVFIQDQPQTLASITLEADLTLISANYYGPLEIGNTFTQLIATAVDQNGSPIENLEIFFELTTPNSEVRLQSSGRTNNLGKAFSTLVPPSTIDSLGNYTIDLSYPASGQSHLRIEDYVPPSASEELFLFVVHTEDDILGIPKNDLLAFYEAYIQAQGTVPGQDKGPLITTTLSGDYSWITGVYEDFIKWEIIHRAVNGMLTPTTYEADDITTGKKTVIITSGSDAINPHTGTVPAFVPVQPTSYSISDGGIDAYFDVTLPLVGDPYAFKSYQLVGPLDLSFIAYAVDEVRDITIYSNAIDVAVDVSDSGKGLHLIDTINELDADTLNAARFWDSEAEGVESVSLSTAGLLPIGWRIRSTGITIASALDRLTFLDINPLSTPDDRINIRFTVI